MKKLILLFALILFSNSAVGQEIRKESLFEGTYNDKPIQIYIQSFMQECTAVIYYKSIVRFLDADRDESQWRKFEVYANDNNGFLLVDDYWNSGRYTNYMFIEQHGAIFKGFIKNEKEAQKNITLERDTTITDFSEFRQEVQNYEDTDDC
ncbi:hypothetical protein I2486_14330 [Cellulophaga sp. E16_2]|uniref:Uncharacterized protein n=1 Tax=Cellulophaga algicola (strain DSM 14237 / IC166 / ACAM 630) TaxID=688270 RepID=E6XDQ4_CELAD|nr:MULTISPECIES: hypothetical protein [Cellulophaga]ADV50196.1 hypothetical protein Celal_2918 [Cellulophaga algicola DSM 14237]MBO0592580.1 hypothetical protein [Cellulophaga sp. E16_2]